MTSDHAAAWSRHRFEDYFTERVLAQIPTPEGHPLFELRLDILAYEVLFCRYVGIPHNPQVFRAECWWDVAGKLVFDSASIVRPSNPPIWKPPTRHLEECLRASCRDYAQGLAWYLLPGREHWGNG